MIFGKRRSTSVALLPADAPQLAVDAPSRPARASFASSAGPSSAPSVAIDASASTASSASTWSMRLAVDHRVGAAGVVADAAADRRAVRRSTGRWGSGGPAAPPPGSAPPARRPAAPAPSPRRALISRTPSICGVKSRTMAWLTVWPARPVPPPRGSTGTPRLRRDPQDVLHVGRARRGRRPRPAPSGRSRRRSRRQGADRGRLSRRRRDLA